MLKLSREILAEVNSQKYYCWEASLFTPITSAETDILFEITQASDCDRDENLYDEDSLITELCEGLCKKLIAKLLPFDLKLTRADDEGVWFIGDMR